MRVFLQRETRCGNWHHCRFARPVAGFHRARPSTTLDKANPIVFIIAYPVRLSSQSGLCFTFSITFPQSAMDFSTDFFAEVDSCSAIYPRSCLHPYRSSFPGQSAILFALQFYRFSPKDRNQHTGYPCVAYDIGN